MFQVHYSFNRGSDVFVVAEGILFEDCNSVSSQVAWL